MSKKKTSKKNADRLAQIVTIVAIALGGAYVLLRVVNWVRFLIG